MVMAGDPEDEGQDFQTGDEEASLNVSQILIPTRQGNPFLDPTVSINDEQYASHYWLRTSHENHTFGNYLDSRTTDRQAENDSQSGVIFYVKKKVPHLRKVLVEKPERQVKGPFGRFLAWINGFKKTTKEPTFGGPEEKTVAELIWEEELERVGLKNADPKTLAKPENTEKLKQATEAYRLRAPEMLEDKRRWFPSTMNLQALKQSPRRPFFFVPDWIFDWCYINEQELKRAVDPANMQEKDWTPYLMVGCDNDEELDSFIRTDERPWDPTHQPPAPLRKKVDQFGNASYEVPRWAEDERALTLRAHNRAVQFVQTAEEVYKWEEVTKRFTGFYDNEKLFGPIEESQESREAFQQWLAAGAQGKPPEMPRSEEAFHSLISAEVRAGNLPKHTAQKKEREFRKYYEDWMEANYDRWLPGECYAYREQFFDRVSIYGPDWESRADAVWEVMSLQIFVIQEPEIIGVYPDLVVDWTKFKAYVAPIENRRDIVRLYNHWKMAKSLNNTRASYDIEGSDIKNARRNDAGGPHTGLKRAIREARYRKLREAAGNDPDKLLRLLGPLWSKKQPWEPIDHDGALYSRFAQAWDSWDDGLKQVRTLSSRAGKGDFPDAGKLRSDYLVKVRSYRSEWWWLQNTEYGARDPLDAWKNQNGIVTLSLLHEVNNRLEGPFAHAPQVRMTYQNCTDFSGFIEMMATNLPSTPIVRIVEEKIASWEHENEEHWRPELNKLLEGVHRGEGRHGLNKYFVGYYRRRGQDDLPVEDPRVEILLINRKPRKNAAGVYERKAFEREWQWVKGWYERSDDRVTAFVYKRITLGSTKGKGGASGAYDFDAKAAGHFNEKGYGLGYGTLGEQQERQMRLVELGLKCTYYQTMKSIIQWFSMEKTIKPFLDFDEDGVEIPKERVTLDKVKRKIIGAIEGGKLLWVYAEYLLWPRLKKMAPEIITGDFPKRHEIADTIDDEFIRHELDYLSGVDSRPSRFKLLRKQAQWEEFEEIIAENHEHLMRVLEGRFFEINEHHAA